MATSERWDFVEAVVDTERVDHERHIDDECNGSLIQKKKNVLMCAVMGRNLTRCVLLRVRGPVV